MLFLITWNSDFLVEQEVKKWKNHFLNKYWDNILHIKDISNIDNNRLVIDITTTSFFSKKKLIIIDINKIIKNKNSTEEKKSKYEELQNKKFDFISSLFDKISDDTILIINWPNIDKRSKFFKSILKYWEIKEFNIITDKKNNSTIWLIKIIWEKYKNKISNKAIELIIRYKSKNLTKIISEIEKLLITFSYIDIKEIQENIYPELEESIFQIIDDIINKDIINTTKKIKIILNDTNIYAFYANLIANLRTYVFIKKLQSFWINNNEIIDILSLWNKSFLVWKNYKISNKILNNLYIDLINIDKKMKNWKLLWSDKNDILFEIEKSLIKNLN